MTSDLFEIVGEAKDVLTTTVTETRLARAYRTDYDLESRNIWISDIESESGDWLRSVLWAFEMEAPNKPITIWLNTPGGSVAAMFQMYDSIVGSPSHITIIGHGEIISAGVLIFIAGHTRLVTENCVFMSHEGAGFSNDGLKYSEAKDRRKYEDWTMQRWAELMARHTRYDVGHWKSITSRKAEFWLLGGQALVDYGIAHAIFDPASKLKAFPSLGKPLTDSAE